MTRIINILVEGGERGTHCTTHDYQGPGGGGVDQAFNPACLAWYARDVGGRGHIPPVFTPPHRIRLLLGMSSNTCYWTSGYQLLLKGAVSRDFLTFFYFMNRSHLSP